VTRREHTSKALRYGTRSQEVSQFYLHTLRSSANRMSHTILLLLQQLKEKLVSQPSPETAAILQTSSEIKNVVVAVVL